LFILYSVLIRRVAWKYRGRVLVRKSGSGGSVKNREGDEDLARPRGVSWKPLRRIKTESLRRRPYDAVAIPTIEIREKKFST
jgi:hypothetical protein